MTPRALRRCLWLAAAIASLATPAFAQAAGGDLGGFLQQLTDLSCRSRPDPVTEPFQVLVLLDEFARLGHVGVLARAFAYVAGYGLRLLPVLQSPAQLRAEYGPDVTEEIITNCAVEVVFAPKELRLANELSERLGYATVRSPSRSRPTGLSRGHRSLTESDQRRALLLPQELTQMPETDLLVLKAGLPPVRGRKIRYYAEPGLSARVQPPPPLPQHGPSEDPDPLGDDAAATPQPLTLDALIPDLRAQGLEPPSPGATPDEVEAWVERYIDAGARPPQEPWHG